MGAFGVIGDYRLADINPEAQRERDVSRRLKISRHRAASSILYLVQKNKLTIKMVMLAVEVKQYLFYCISIKSRC